jgi:hypothetical protein
LNWVSNPSTRKRRGNRKYENKQILKRVKDTKSNEKLSNIHLFGVL